MKKVYTKLKNKIHQVLEKPLQTTFIVLVLVTIVVVTLSIPFYIEDFRGYGSQVLVEAHGMIFDILIIGMLLLWLNQKGEKRKEIRMYRDEIDDFRTWKSEESAFRTVGNIKRLNRHKIYDIDLGGTYLVNVNLSHMNLTNSNINSATLSKSVFIETVLDNTRLNQSSFDECNLNQASLKGAYANACIFEHAFLIKADLSNAFLIKANFRDAFLMEADLRNTYVMGADFANASLYKADFRGAKGLTVEQLLPAKTLYLAKFDEKIMDELKKHHQYLIGLT